MRLAILAVLAASLHAAAPDVYRVQFHSSAGDFTLEVHRDWSPHAADRIFELVNAKYFDDSRFYRVVEGRWVQFGIAGDPKISQAWRHRTIPDDTVKQSNTLGYVGFANTGPDTRSTQIYINLGDNSRNDREAGFAPFAKVIEGMDVVVKLYSGYGEHSGGGMRAGHQDQMFEEGNAYLDREFPNLSRLLTASIVR
ncbi:MAG TPA: peptidylprolyl isomerase [Bryobacteraceae bacterium]|nr:peptidylprolyl isomerase [Bryobacteraceae bacterium]